MNRDLDTGLTRRKLLQLGLVLPASAVAAAYGGSLLDANDLAAAPLATTPSCDDGDDPTPAQTKGPYFTPDSPLKRSLVRAGDAGTRLTLTGYVLTTSCRPVRRALIDFWQANARGVYDNNGDRFRGHQFTDSAGRYRLETVLPGLYPGRTRHIHVKVQAPGEPVLTTQLYFPGEPRNRTDSIFDTDLLLGRWRTVGARRVARFDFVLDLD
jgi:protocatechuate 3,4-dioxygenase beta subunit